MLRTEFSLRDIRLCHVARSLSPQVLRRQQLGLKTQEPEDEKAKKAGPRGAKQPGKPKAKAGAKAKAKAAPKRQASQKPPADDAVEPSKHTAAKSKAKRGKGNMPADQVDAESRPFLDPGLEPADELPEPSGSSEPAGKRRKKVADAQDEIRRVTETGSGRLTRAMVLRRGAVPRSHVARMAQPPLLGGWCQPRSLGRPSGMRCARPSSASFGLS